MIDNFKILKEFPFYSKLFCYGNKTSLSINIYLFPRRKRLQTKFSDKKAKTSDKSQCIQTSLFFQRTDFYRV